MSELGKCSCNFAPCAHDAYAKVIQMLQDRIVERSQVREVFKDWQDTFAQIEQEIWDSMLQRELEYLIDMIRVLRGDAVRLGEEQ